MLLLHVHSAARAPLSPFDGHLVRNLSWVRFDPHDVDAEVDVLLLSTEDPLAVEQVLREVRSRRPTLRVIIRQGPDTGSRSSAGDDNATWWVDEGPIPLSELMLALRGPETHRADHSRGAPHGSPSPMVIDLRRGVPRGGGRSMLQARLGEGAEVLGASARAFLLDTVQPPDRVEPTVPAHAVEAAPSALAPPAPSPAAALVPAAPAPATPPVSRRRRETLEDATTSPAAHVSGLLASLDGLYGLRETADAVAQHLRDTVEAEAVAVLVPDDTVWAVAGAIGHRHLEERLTLAADHWLVQEVCGAHHGVVVEDTDIARTRLAGAPLAAWPRLMALPMPEVQGILILARSTSGTAFTARHLNQAARVLAEAEGLFAAAVQLRELARRLQPFAELDVLHPQR